MTHAPASGEQDDQSQMGQASFPSLAGSSWTRNGGGERIPNPDSGHAGSERVRGSGGTGMAPGTAGKVVPFVEPDARCDQAAFGIVSLTVLTLSTTTSLSSVPVSR